MRRLAARGAPSRAAATPAPAPWRLEVQIHPGDIRRRVRYLFLSRAHLTAWCLAVLGYVALVALGVGLAPQVVSAFLGAQEARGLANERTRQGERLRTLVGQLEGLRGRSENLRLQVQKVVLAYGLSEGVERPPARPAPPVPESIYASSVQQGRRLSRRVRQELRVTAAFLDRVRAHEAAHRGDVPATPSVAPVRGQDFVLLSPFGRRRNPFTEELQFHAGVDLAAPQGTPVYAPADGEVIFAGRYPMSGITWWRLGNLLVLRNGRHFVTLYGHCHEILVRRGRRVRRGDLVATVGNSGWSVTPHLHYEVRRRRPDGELVPVDPRLFMLDHRWRDDERLVVRARDATAAAAADPLPAGFRW
jgi:murein DD-endopeptidase MepM/ murein hydrolase activator NlpD